MPAVDAVCFDLDSTLCLSDQSDHEIHAATFEAVDVDPLFTPADVRGVDPDDVETAESDAEFYTNLYRATVADLDVDHDPSLLETLGGVTADVVDETAVSFREGAREALEHASERYEVGLITNGGEATQTAKLETLGIADAFDVAVFCDPANGIHPKPHSKPFELATAALDAAPERTLYVGDTHGVDVVGAHEFGMQTAWVPMDREHESVPTDPDPAPTHRLEHPGDLLTVL